MARQRLRARPKKKAIRARDVLVIIGGLCVGLLIGGIAKLPKTNLEQSIPAVSQRHHDTEAPDETCAGWRPGGALAAWAAGVRTNLDPRASGCAVETCLLASSSSASMPTAAASASRNQVDRCAARRKVTMHRAGHLVTLAATKRQLLAVARTPLEVMKPPPQDSPLWKAHDGRPIDDRSGERFWAATLRGSKRRRGANGTGLCNDFGFLGEDCSRRGPITPLLYHRASNFGP